MREQIKLFSKGRWVIIYYFYSVCKTFELTKVYGHSFDFFAPSVPETVLKTKNEE